MNFNALNLLQKYERLGKQELSNGTLLIGKAPHIAPKAWLHCIFSALSSGQIDSLEKECKHLIPSSYKEFLLKTNGLTIFNTTLSLYGKRENYVRNVENVWQPFDIITPNTLERPKNANNNLFIIGSYNYDGSKLYIDNTTSKVYLCDRYDVTPLYEWSNFEEMLDSEIKRLISMFDSEGRKLNKAQSTLPRGCKINCVKV